MDFPRLSCFPVPAGCIHTEMRGEDAKMWLRWGLLCLVLMHGVTRADDDEDEDVYTTTDPKKREPTPCEGKQHVPLNSAVKL